MLPVLMYHGLHEDERSHGRFDPVYSVRPADFARQLDWLLAHGYRSAGLDDVHDATGATGRVLLTFDDGDVSNVERALPMLRERGLSAVFFITSGFVGTPGMLAAHEVRALAEAGMVIGAHGRSHAFLEDLPEDALRSELEDSKRMLEQLASQGVQALALPGGRGGAREHRLAREAGYWHLFGSRPGPNRGSDPSRWMERIAITRDLGVEEFAALVQWRGLRPRLASFRHRALALPKRVLGNAGYERLRARLL